MTLAGEEEATTEEVAVVKALEEAEDRVTVTV